MRHDALRTVPVLVLATPAGVFAQTGTAPAEPPVSFPHPMITEVMFDVPRGADGDANRDGKRDPAGDEFVELYNPHDEPIDLRGYTLTNWLTTGEPDQKRGVRFEFPRFELEPGRTVVVFNGYQARIRGAVGTERRAPRSPNEHFADAFVFRTANSSANNAFNNSDDFVLLASPAGEKVDAVVWGNAEFLQLDDALNVADVSRSPGGSVQRPDPDSTDLWPHPDIDAEACSPGEQPWMNPTP